LAHVGLGLLHPITCVKRGKRSRFFGLAKKKTQSAFAEMRLAIPILTANYVWSL
jgi:hypothetical protein